LDIKRQLQVVEQEATVLRTKTQSLEQENDKLLGEVKVLQLQAARSTSKSFSLTSTKEKAEANKIKETLELVEKERDALAQKLKTILEESVDKLPKRAPKRYVDSLTKLQLKVTVQRPIHSHMPLAPFPNFRKCLKTMKKKSKRCKRLSYVLAAINCPP
jgi:chromosome segregation ATPase